MRHPRLTVNHTLERLSVELEDVLSEDMILNSRELHSQFEGEFSILRK